MKRPKGTLVLNTTFDCYSAGTRIEFIEYVDNNTKVLGRICGVQQTVPIELVTERRERYTALPARKKGEVRKIGVFKN